MKRNLLLAIATLLLAGSFATAQDWKEALKKAATTAADKATDGKLTQYALAGTWNYTAPGVKFEGNDLLSQLGGTVLQDNIKQQLDKGYQMAGIKPGAGTVTFAKDGKFTTLMGKYELSGTYEFDASTHVATLNFAKDKLDLGSVPGHAYIDGSNLLLVFPVTKLIDMVKAMGSKISSMGDPSSRCSKTTKRLYRLRIQPSSGRKCEVGEKNYIFFQMTDSQRICHFLLRIFTPGPSLPADSKHKRV